VRYDADGLVPCVVQDAAGGEVLMVAYADREALAATLAIGEAHFWSRSRRELWRKGATSGNVLRVLAARLDCDHDTVLLTGPTGVGKSYLACALGNFAARQGHTVLYLRAPRLFEMLLQSKADGSHLRMLTRLAKVQLLVLDDLFLTPLDDPQRNDLLEIIEDRYQKTPTVITSQCPIKDWHAIIGEPTVADSILDRLLHHAYKIELKGESIRKTKK